MRFLAGLALLVVLAACADLPPLFRLYPYEPWKKENQK
jgi:hypothetical protein